MVGQEDNLSHLSAALMAFLASSFVADATALLLTENVGKTTQRFTFTIFVSFVMKSVEYKFR